MRRTILAAFAAAALMLTAAAPAAAQPRQEGLVNVYASDTTVQIPIAIAANVCGVAVNVLAQAENFGDVDCTAEGVSLAENEGGNGQAPRQSGLVNVALVGTTVQVPVSVAANVCGVAVNVLATAGNFGDVDCDAFAESGAEN
jgi:hypothetical protein